MKRKTRAFKVTWLLVFLLLPLSAALAQQNDSLPEEEEPVLNTAHDRVLKLHPLQIGEVYASYEKLRTTRVSNVIGLSYVYKAYLRGNTFLPDDRKVHGLGIRMSQRHYTSRKKEAPFGFFHGPLFGYRFMVFEKNAFNQPELAASDPAYEHISRLYQNSLELSYQAGGQFLLGKQLTMEIAGGIGARVKYAYAKKSGDLLAQNIIGHTLAKEDNSLVALVPVPQLSLSVGYSF